VIAAVHSLPDRYASNDSAGVIALLDPEGFISLATAYFQVPFSAGGRPPVLVRGLYTMRELDDHFGTMVASGPHLQGDPECRSSSR
jgi:hypothetical protein